VSQDFKAFYQHRASQGPEETVDPDELRWQGVRDAKEESTRGDQARGGATRSQAQDRLSQGEKR